MCNVTQHTVCCLFTHTHKAMQGGQISCSIVAVQMQNLHYHDFAMKCHFFFWNQFTVVLFPPSGSSGNMDHNNLTVNHLILRCKGLWFLSPWKLWAGLN